MLTTNTTRLHLLAPLRYAKSSEVEPFAYGGRELNGEQIFCFAIEPEQSRSIEPDARRFLGARLFAGRSPEKGADINTAETVTLPSGIYLFTQQREALEKEACVALAIEQQKDGLWERRAPGNLLYVRYLFEDGKPVTQILRVCDEN